MNRRIVEYEIVSFGVMGFLVETVMSRIASGWRPFGTPFTYYIDGTAEFAQAMVRYADEG